MTPQARRRLIPVIVLFLVGSVLSVLIFGPKRPENTKSPTAIETVDETGSVESAVPKKASEKTEEPIPEVANENLKPFEVLHLATQSEPSSDVVLGSLLAYKDWKMEVVFT